MIKMRVIILRSSPTRERRKPYQEVANYSTPRSLFFVGAQKCRRPFNISVHTFAVITIIVLCVGYDKTVVNERTHSACDKSDI